MVRRVLISYKNVNKIVNQIQQELSFHNVSVANVVRNKYDDLTFENCLYKNECDKPYGG